MASAAQDGTSRQVSTGRRLSGRIAVVTGGSGGLGQAIAERLAQDGADVAVLDQRSGAKTRKLVEASGARYFDAICDVADPHQVQSFAADVHHALGEVDIIVNNAAIAKKVRFDDLAFEEWKHFFAINVHGYFLVTKAFLDDLKRSRAGRVINLSSTSVWLGGPAFTPYVAAKGAINGFTNSLAADLGEYGITVNAIAPSLVRTPATCGIHQDEGFARVAAMQTLKREQSPKDVANVAAFLASDDASFITGQILVSDGGLTRR